MPHTSATITLKTALAHEALYPRLEALLKQVEKLAVRRPESSAEPELIRIAEALCLAARQFGALPGRRRERDAATSNAALAARLAQARAALDAFEAEHAPWDAARKCHCWRLPNDTVRPVARLRQQAVPEVNYSRHDIDEKRDRLIRLIDSKYAEGYREGYRAGSGGEYPPEVPENHLTNRIAQLRQG